MVLANIVNFNNDKVGEMDLENSVFGVPFNGVLLSEVVRWHMSCKRLGTKSNLTKSEVHGTTKKPFPQKGRGMARQGSLKNPHQRGGGVAFAAKSRDYSYPFPKCKKKAALLTSLSVRIAEKNVRIINNLLLEQGKTKQLALLLQNLNIEKCLIVDCLNIGLKRAAYNLRNVKYVPVAYLNSYDILKYPKLLITESAILEFQEKILCM